MELAWGKEAKYFFQQEKQKHGTGVPAVVTPEAVMFSGQRRWQRSDQGSASMGELQENSKCPRESWWRFPEGDTALGAAGEVQEPMEKANQQWSEGLVWFCRGCFPGEQVWTTCGYSKSKEGVMNSGKWSVSFTKQPQCKKNSGAEQTKNCKTWENLGKNPLRRQQKGGKPRQDPDAKRVTARWTRRGVLPGRNCSCPYSDGPKWWGINSLVPQRSGLSSRHSLDQKLCYLQQRKLLRWFPSPLFSQKEEKLSQGRNQIKSSYRTVPFKFCFWWVSHHPTPYIFLFYIPVSVV